MYLVDTSALYPLIKKLGKKITQIVNELAILDLTIYEIGNVLWKTIYFKNELENQEQKIRKLEEIIKSFSEILFQLKTYTINQEDFTQIAKTAIKKGLTFYDASYIYISNKHNITLITEDKEILENHERAITTNKLISQIHNKNRLVL